MLNRCLNVSFICRATTTVLGNIPKTDIYEDVDVTKNAREIEGIKIIRYEASLYYANVENFTYKIQKLSGIKPDEIIESIKKLEDQLAKQKKKIQAKRNRAEKKLKKGERQYDSCVSSSDEVRFSESFSTYGKVNLDRDFPPF